MHKTLERQLNKLRKKYEDLNRLPDEFIKAINDTYLSFEKEQKRKDRAIHLMAEELEEVNRQNQENSEAYTSAILSSIVDGVITVSVEGTILSLNHTAERVIGQRIDDVRNKKLVTLIDEYEDFEEMIADLGKEEKRRHNVLVRNHSEEKIPCTVSISYFDKFDHPIYILILQDVSEQQKAAKKIRELNKNLKDHVHQLEVSNNDLESFSYSISHDLRAPLGFIRNFVTILHERNAHQFDNKSETLIEMIRKHIHRMEHLIDDILDFSRSGQKEPDKSNVDVSKLVNKILKEQTSLPGHHRICVHELLPAWCDGSLIYQVFSNLISNALKYSSKVKDPFIEIGSKKINGMILYFVTDNGAGFDESESDNIFEPFKRLHPEEEFKGTGIGLAITRRIVVKHGGKIWARGKKNMGAEFFFTLPVSFECLDNGRLVSNITSDNLQEQGRF